MRDDDSLVHATVLVELGWLHDADDEVADALDAEPDDATALSLYAKIKHLRGELSQAIACWAQLHAQSAQNQRAELQLHALLHLAEDPESGAGEFLAIGRYQLARKPSGRLALEEAFRMFHARRPDLARERCEELARRYAGKDLDTYKLAVLANAWIAELSGDTDDARHVLEALARERGFETDPDRLFALARVYETLAAPERLGAAIKIYRHLEREYSTDGTDKLQLVSNLAALYRRLEMQPAALEYERKFVTAFRRRMHRPSFADTVRAAARRYIGLRHLLGIRFVSTTPPDSATIRERGIAAALTGEAGLARERLSSGDALLDRKYLADLAVITHDDAVAAALYVSALAEDPYDPQILTAVLALHARTGATVVVEHFRQLGAFARARETLEREMHRAPLRPSLWHAQARLLRLQGNAEAADRSEQRAVSLAEAMRRRAHPVGRALSASVYHFLGKAEGLVHEVWAHRTPVDRGAGGALRPEQVLGNLTRDMKDGVLNTFYAVREYALAKFPERAADLFDYDYTYKVPKEDEPSGGLSAGLPSALAFLSVFLQRPIPQDIALSGILVADAHDVLTVRRVGEPDLKVQAAYHRNLRQLVLPAENSPELSATWKVPRDVCQEIVRFVSNVDDVVKLVWDDGVFVAA